MAKSHKSSHLKVLETRCRRKQNERTKDCSRRGKTGTEMSVTSGWRNCELYNISQLYAQIVCIMFSVTRMGDFLQILGNKKSHKSSPNLFVDFLFYLFLIMLLLYKKCVATFRAIFAILGNFLFLHLVTLIMCRQSPPFYKVTRWSPKTTLMTKSILGRSPLEHFRRRAEVAAL